MGRAGKLKINSNHRVKADLDFRIHIKLVRLSEYHIFQFLQNALA